MCNWSLSDLQTLLKFTCITSHDKYYHNFQAVYKTSTYKLAHNIRNEFCNLRQGSVLRIMRQEQLERVATVVFDPNPTDTITSFLAPVEPDPRYLYTCWSEFKMIEVFISFHLLHHTTSGNKGL